MKFETSDDRALYIALGIVIIWFVGAVKVLKTAVKLILKVV